MSSGDEAAPVRKPLSRICRFFLAPLAGLLFLSGTAPLAHAAPGPSRPLVRDAAAPLFITGLRGTRNIKQQINVYSRGNVTPLWSWVPPGDEPGLSCLRESYGVTEAKWAANGTRIAAIVGNGVVVVSYPGGDILFGACNNTNMHSVEMLPGNRIAVADTGSSAAGGVWVYSMDRRIATEPIQRVGGLPSSHGLLWDETAKVLWAVGTNRWPQQGSDSPDVHGLLVAYRYDSAAAQPLSQQAVHTMRKSPALPEWPGWYDGPHDIAPVPGQRELLVTTDLTVFVFDIDRGAFSGASDTYLKGFGSHVRERDDAGQPLSGMKSIGLSPTDGIIYAQPSWKADFANTVGFATEGRRRPGFMPGGSLYKARWFRETPGWPTAR
ncbi:hypothetical protein [Streptomyces netropsis]|uniref:Uncharacterized protein n=1 Tax=Streptomyces netropsis TaxID=55404 RepID=A0A7W7PFP0_STRNE|nr:hypothetical protein [Streptomyces netropsis]MBB4889086.1 hypothetical protein [Streptomyces netropsis]GGR08059.1 hypothetical protein GCM10010219_10360 [Streptomyces netropsis]